MGLAQLNMRVHGSCEFLLSLLTNSRRLEQVLAVTPASSVLGEEVFSFPGLLMTAILVSFFSSLTKSFTVSVRTATIKAAPAFVVSRLPCLSGCLLEFSALPLRGAPGRWAG